MSNNIENKVSEYLLGLCDHLQDGSVESSKLPLSEIKKVLAGALSNQKSRNDLEYLDVLTEQNILMLEQAIKDNNILYTVMTLQLMACQCLHSFSVDSLWRDAAQKQLVAYSEENNHAWEEYLATYKERNEFIQRSYSDKYITKEKGSRFSGRGVVYTAITGGFDDLRAPEFVTSELDYICFTDNTNFKSDVWQVRIVDNCEGLDDIRVSKKYKILAHEVLSEYDYSIWLDGKIKLLRDPRELINMYAVSSGLLAFPHYERDCIYDEAKACLMVNKGNPTEIKSQIERYRQEGYPEHNGMIDAACLIRNHHDETLKKVMETWWHEVKNESYRDQLSFGYSCYKHKYEYDLCNMYIYNNSFLKTYEHNQDLKDVENNKIFEKPRF